MLALCSISIPPPRKRQRTVRKPKISLRFQGILEGIEMEHWSRFI